jgi:hypothetical protein
MQDRYQQEVIKPGDKASRLAREICFASHTNCAAVRVVPHQPDNFRGPVGFVFQDHILDLIKDGDMLIETENDGAGGKPQFFTLVGTSECFKGLGWEIITMCADDFARSGRFPAIMINNVDVKRITDKNFPLVEAMFTGYGEALAESNLVNITGEIAVMKHSITAFCETDPETQLILTWAVLASASHTTTSFWMARVSCLKWTSLVYGNPATAAMVAHSLPT